MTDLLKITLVILSYLSLFACDNQVLNNPYSASAEKNQAVLYASFSERPRHLDPAKSYSANEYAFIGQIYEPPFQYHYLKRPYELEPLTATKMPEIIYLDSAGRVLSKDATANSIAFSDYIIDIRATIKFQPHAALAKDQHSEYLYHQLTPAQLSNITLLSDFTRTGTRELVATDYVHQIKRLAHPHISSPISELMQQYIIGLEDYAKTMQDKPLTALTSTEISGVAVLSKYRYKIRIKGKYPQFIYWLAMPFFSPMPWEADVFYSQKGLIDKNITLDWQPLGTGPFMLEENNPNLRMVMLKNPNYHAAFYPKEGELGDREKNLLEDAGKRLPFIDKAIYRLEKETIPYWNKFLQGYYDASGIASDSFDQAIQFTGDGELGLTEAMQKKGIQLQTAVTNSIFYMGFNMLDSMVGGSSERARKLRLAISIAIDYEEYISIFRNGRGVVAHDVIPPGIFGFSTGKQGINSYIYHWDDQQARRKPLQSARQLMQEAGYVGGIDKQTGEALILYLDTVASGADDRARLNWYRKQFAKLGIQLVIRATDYNRFQQKMLNGNAQIFMWGWNADYPDPENFFFLLYGANSKVKQGGENAVNYQNSDFDRLFKQMSHMENNPERLAIIKQMQEIIRHDAPWVYGFHPKVFSLSHRWYHNLKPHSMANNKLKYQRIDSQRRKVLRLQWNQPVLWPVILIFFLVILISLPAVYSFQRRAKETIK